MSLLHTIASALNSLRTPAPVLDPAVFGDPTALLTEWTPLVRGGSNFRTHAGSQTAPDRYEFRATWGLRLFALAFGLLGGGVPLAILPGILWSDADAPPATFLVLLVPAVFLAAAAFLWFHVGRAVVFDRREGWTWKGRVPPSEDPSVAGASHACPLERVRALQIVPERVSSKNGSYTSWELNLVLDDGSRRNVTDHGAGDALRNDATDLAAFLGVPLWNAQDAMRPPS